MQQCMAATRHMHMIVKDRMKDGGIAQAPAQQFYSLVG
jgi:hypothetical protein